MEVIGKIIVALPEVSGISKAKGNPWKKREYVLETINEQYPKKIFFDFFGDRADQFPLKVGDTIKLSFDIDSSEYNGRWYTHIRGWKSEPYVEGAPAAAAPAPTAAPAAPSFGAPVPPAAAPQPMTGGMPIPPAADGASDDLPF